MALNWLSAISLNVLWGMLNGIQLICHLPLYQLKVPANSGYFFKFMIEIATFDPLPIDAIWAVFTFPARDSFSESFASAGYSHLYSIENFGTAALVIHAGVFAAAICLILPRINSNMTSRIV